MEFFCEDEEDDEGTRPSLVSRSPVCAYASASLSRRQQRRHVGTRGKRPGTVQTTLFFEKGRSKLLMLTLVGKL